MRLALLLLALLAVPAAATEGERVYRLDMLASSTAIIADTRQWIPPEVARAGFSDGRNLILDARVGNPAELPELARNLV